MKIYRNSVAIELTLDEFLEVVESDMLDEMLLVVMELDVTAEAKAQGKSWNQVKKEMIDPAPIFKPLPQEEYIVEGMDDLKEFLASMGLDADDYDIEVIEYDGDIDDLGDDFWNEYGEGVVFMDEEGQWHGDLDGNDAPYYTTYDENEEDLTSEDRKVRRILNRYRFMTE
jgi:hypothetical protein